MPRVALSASALSPPASGHKVHFGPEPHSVGNGIPRADMKSDRNGLSPLFRRQKQERVFPATGRYVQARMLSTRPSSSNSRDDQLVLMSWFLGPKPPPRRLQGSASQGWPLHCPTEMGPLNLEFCEDHLESPPAPGVLRLILPWALRAGDLDSSPQFATSRLLAPLTAAGHLVALPWPSF